MKTVIHLTREEACAEIKASLEHKNPDKRYAVKAMLSTEYVGYGTSECAQPTVHFEATEETT